MTEDVEELQTMVQVLRKELLVERERIASLAHENRNLEAEREDLMNEMSRSERD